MINRSKLNVLVKSVSNIIFCGKNLLQFDLNGRETQNAKAENPQNILPKM
jgi:hypothetical protein